MPNPPTYDDLRRRRHSGKFKLPTRIKIIFNGTGPLPPIPIPDLPLPDLTTFLGLEIDYIPTDNIIGTESFDALNILAYSDEVTYNSELYAGSDLDVLPSNYPFDSLWFINNTFTSKGVYLNKNIESVGMQSFQREFYPVGTSTKVTSSYSFSSYDYKDLNVSLSSNISNVESSFIYPQNITYTNALCTGKVIQEKVNFKINYGDGNTSDVFNTINSIKNHIYTFTEPFTGIKTAILSTIRADGVYDVNITSLPISFNIDTPYFYTPRAQNIQTTWQTISAEPNPDGQEDKFRFLNSPTTVSGVWNTEWWGYNSRNLYNFSGVSYKGSGNPNENNITLITPKHGVCNSHYGGVGPGDIIYYYDHTTGTAVSAIVADREVTGVDDITVVKFDRDLTAEGDIKVYKLPLYTDIIPTDTFCTIYQGGNGPFGTGSSDRHAGLGTHSAINDVIGTPLFDTELGKTDLWSVSSIFENTYFSLSSLDVGDSSSPTFIILEDDILLASSFWFGWGGGPNYGLSAIQAVLSSGIETLGNSEGYTLSTVKLS